MYGISYMFQHYIIILRECIVDGRVMSSDVVSGDLRSPRTTSPKHVGATIHN
jgi:hypothetical protein